MALDGILYCVGRCLFYDKSDFDNGFVEPHMVKERIRSYELSDFARENEKEMNYPQPTDVGWGFCYAASRHEPADPLDPAEQGMSTMPLSHWVTFGNTFLKMFPAPLISALVMVPS